MYQSFTLWTLGHHREYKATQLADYISPLGKIYVRSYQGCRIHIKKKNTHYAKVRPFHRLLSYFCTSLTVFYAVHAVSTLSDGQKQLSLKFIWYIVANNDTYTLHMHPKKGMPACFGSPYLDNRGATSKPEIYCFVQKKKKQATTLQSFRSCLCTRYPCGCSLCLFKKKIYHAIITAHE